MKYSIIDRFVDGVDELCFKLAELLGGNPDKFVDLVAADSPFCLTTKDGSLLTAIRINGYESLCGDREFGEIVSKWNTFLRRYLDDKSGREIHWYWEMDPDEGKHELERLLKPSRNQARRMGLQVDDLFDEKIMANAKYVHLESSLIVIVTRLSDLSDTSVNSALKNQKAEQEASGSYSPECQPLGRGVPDLRENHSELIQAFLRNLTDWGFSADLINSHDFLVESKSALYGREVGSRFSPKFRTTSLDTLSSINKNGEEEVLRQEGKLALRQPDPSRPESQSAMSASPLAEQLLDTRIDSLDDDRYLHLGDRFAGPVQVVRHTNDPHDFDGLISKLKKINIPVRIAFHITSNGLATRGFGIMLASILSFTGSRNRKINKNNKDIDAMVDSEGDQVFAGLSITATTWAPAVKRLDPETKMSYGDLTLIQRRTKQLIDTLNEWGEVSANQRYGNAAEVYISTCVGLTVGHNVAPCPAPLTDVLAMLPITRIAPAWENGSHIFRTEDGLAVPYEQFSSKQAAWITALVGPQGTAKSMTMFLLNFAFIVQPSSENTLPFLRAVDFQESQRGLVDLIKAGLPLERQHEAQFISLENHERFAGNIFDLPLLGLDQPLPDHIKFISRYLALIVTSLDQYVSKIGLIGAVINEAYNHYRNDDDNINAKRYSPGTNSDIDRALLKHELSITTDSTTWYEVRDKLFDVGEHHLTIVAQRYAMPIMEDLPMIAAKPEITSEYKENIGDLTVTELFSRGIREAIGRYKYLRGYTKFSIADSRIGFFDLAKMLDKGDGEQDQRDNAAAIFFAFRLLVSDFWYSDKDLDYFSVDKYRRHAENYFHSIQTLPKRFGADEIHRISGIKSAEELIDQMNLEGRKNLVDLMLATQRLMSHTPATRELATTMIICGLGNDAQLKDLDEAYKFSDSEISVIDNLKGISSAGSNAVYRFKLKKGTNQTLSLFSTEGAKMLWAGATDQTDRALRRLLYKKFSQKEARRRLAGAYPSGTIKEAFEERKMRALNQEDAEGSIIKVMADELCDDSRFPQEEASKV